jgi:hypothetical protein
VRERNGEVGLGSGPAEVECDGVVGARRRVGGVEGADPHAPPLAGCRLRRCGAEVPAQGPIVAAATISGALRIRRWGGRVVGGVGGR